MRNLLLLSLVAVGTTVALTGSYSALAGHGPVGNVVAAVLGSDETKDDDATVVSQEAGEGADAAGSGKVAQVIADEFEVTQEEVLALHDEGIGFGALFKLYALAKARGISVNDLLAEIAADGGGFAFGKMFKALSDEEEATLESGPRNLGKLVSASNNDDGDGGEAEATAAGAAESSHGPRHGPPEFAKAHGRR